MAPTGVSTEDPSVPLEAISNGNRDNCMECLCADRLSAATNWRYVSSSPQRVGNGQDTFDDRGMLRLVGEDKGSWQNQHSTDAAHHHHQARLWRVFGLATVIFCLAVSAAAFFR